MRLAKYRYVIALAAVFVLAVATVASASSTDGTVEPRTVDADTINGHGAAASSASPVNRANNILWAMPNGNLSLKALPIKALDKRYLGSAGDTFHFIPGAELQFWMDADPEARALIGATGQAIVYKDSPAESIDVVIPVNLPGYQSGRYVKIVNFRLYYRVADTATYIDRVWLLKLDPATGGTIVLVDADTHLNSTAWTSVSYSCGVADCQLSWPSVGFISVALRLDYAAVGHEITIGGVLLRVSYD